MSLNPLIINTLKDLAPTHYLTYKGPAETYILFSEYNQTGSMYADDEEKNTRHSIQVDVYSKTDFTQLVRDVKQRLKDKGFSRHSEFELYEDDTGFYHKVIRFYYVD